MGGCISRRFLDPAHEEEAIAPPRCPPSATGSMQVLPLDILCQILLYLPAKTLCRFRTVCRLWRYLISDRQFITEHAARHPEPFVLAAFRNDQSGDMLLDIMDLSGQLMKHVLKYNEAEEESLESAQLDLICTSRWSDLHLECKLFNPATGVVYHLPEQLAPEHVEQVSDIQKYSLSQIAWGQVASVGGYKVLRVLHPMTDIYPQQLCEVITLNGSSHAMWRGTKAPQYDIPLHRSKVVISGIVYFILDRGMDKDVFSDRIASFDLETEEWRATIRGPISTLLHNNPSLRHNRCYGEARICGLNDHLVVAHTSSEIASVDLWFLVDTKKVFWVKQHSISKHEGRISPLLTLHDGRILVYGGKKGSLRIYDPMTNIIIDLLDVGSQSFIGMYTGNLLSLPNVVC